MPNGEICLRVWSQHATRVARVYSTRPCSSLAKVVGDNSGIILHDTANTLRSPYVIGRRRNATSLCSLTPIMEQSRVTNLESFLYTTAPITNCVSFRNAPAVMVANEGEVESQAGKPLNSLVHHHVVKVEPGEPGCRRAWKSSRGMRLINFEHSEC